MSQDVSIRRGPIAKSMELPRIYGAVLNRRFYLFFFSLRNRSLSLFRFSISISCSMRYVLEPHLGQIVEFDTSSEALIFTPEGSPIHGLTGGFGPERRVEHIIPERFWKPKGSSGVYEIYVEGSCNGLFGIDNMDPPDVSRRSLRKWCSSRVREIDKSGREADGHRIVVAIVA